MTATKDTVLVVDDRPASRYAIVHALKRAGFEVIEAETGKDALELAKQVPSAILLDVKLPDILGYEVCRRLKTNPRTNHIPVVQLSAAFKDNESRIYALESGADAYLAQPVEPGVLVATVKSLIKVHEAESVAKLSAKQWQATFDALSEGVAVLDQFGKVQRCNRAMSDLLERTYSEIEGRTMISLLDESFGIHLADIGLRGVQEVSSGARYLRIHIEPVFLDDLRSGSIFVVADITQQKLAEHAALQNERLAATGRMAHTIAHEINNPLEAITNLLYLLKNSEPGSGEAKGFLTSAEDELARVSRISRQILSFHRESGVPIELDIPELIENVLALNQRALAEKNLRIRREWNDGICVCGFPAQLRQVFSNLFRNAVEASVEGGEIRVRISPSTIHAEPAARVTVADCGAGIPERNLEKIFNAFFTTKELKGTGIGLWLSSTIVQEHRGRIQVKSSTHPGRSGTCMSVLLPYKHWHSGPGADRKAH